MLNRYSPWKYVLLALLLIISLLYALPNIYGEDPSVQISAQRGADISLSAVDEIKKILDEKKLTYKSVDFTPQSILVRFNDTDTQINAREQLFTQLTSENYIVALNLAPATPRWLASIGANPMKLGLDLRGGVHFLMEVDMDAALDKLLVEQESSFRSILQKERIRTRGVKKEPHNREISVYLINNTDMEPALSALGKEHPDMLLQKASDLQIKATFTPSKIQEVEQYAVEQNVNILRNRVNELGVAEPLVQRQGSNRIVVELPGVQDTARAKEILGATATLSFREVDMENRNVNKPAIGSERLPRRDGGFTVVKQREVLSGAHITDASFSIDHENGAPQVNIHLDSSGGKKMTTFSQNNIGKLMATVFTEYKDQGLRDSDGKVILEKHQDVINEATIQSALGRQFRITGIPSPAEARNLALLLRAGALIAPITIVEERTIGPSMGQQNVTMGVQACLAGLVIVMLFTGIYYRSFGLIANAGLIFNILMIIAIMSLIPGATMTLPGIAGIVLTVGMAVDANVLIFERIREEVVAGETVQQSIHKGYANALSTIADANITTLITAFILFAVGTGAIKGFAVTLSIGILTSMFTAIIVTRAIVNYLYGSKSIDKLSI